MKQIDIRIGDCLDEMNSIPSNSIHCCVTSPPYYQLRDYGVEGQIGLEDTVEEYINKMVLVFQEVRRILRPDGTVWLNLGDTYASTQSSDTKKFGNEQFNKNRSCREQCKIPKKSVPSGFKRGELMGIPWRVALALQASGWYLISDVIWHKPNCMPESVKKRPTKSHDYVFLLSKSPTYYYDYVAIQEPVKESSLKRYRYPMKGGTPGTAYLNEDRKKPHNFNLDGGAKYKNKRSVWTIPTRGYAGSHFATFPLNLVDVCLKAGTSEKGCCPICGSPYVRIIDQNFVPQQDIRDLTKLAKSSNKRLDTSNNWGDYPRGMTITTTIGWGSTCSCHAGDPIPCTVVDPFAGSGTVGEWCRHNNRSCILIELNGNYKPLIIDRTMASVPPLEVYQ